MSEEGVIVKLTDLLAEKGYKMVDGQPVNMHPFVPGSCLSMRIRLGQELRKELSDLKKLYPTTSLEELLHSLLLNREAQQMTDEEFILSFTKS